MRIDLDAETPVTLRDARERHIPKKSGRPIAPSTLWRWIRRGCRGADGRIVRLEVVRVGGQPMTTREAIHRFIGELSETSRSK